MYQPNIIANNTRYVTADSSQFGRKMYRTNCTPPLTSINSSFMVKQESSQTLSNNFTQKNTRNDNFNNKQVLPKLYGTNTTKPTGVFFDCIPSPNIESINVSYTMPTISNQRVQPHVIYIPRTQESNVKFQNTRYTQNLKASTSGMSQIGNKENSVNHENYRKLSTAQNTDKRQSGLHESLNATPVKKMYTIPKEVLTVGPATFNDNSATIIRPQGTTRNVQGYVQSAESLQHTGTEIKRFGSTPSEKISIFTGTVDKIIQWNKQLKNHFCYYEVIATVVSLQEGPIKTQKIMLLRDRTGPVLQVVYYLLTHINLDDFHLGKTVRCVGSMVGHNIFHAICIRGASLEEVENLQRLTLISEQAISLLLKNEI